MKRGFLQRCKTLRNPIRQFEKENINTLDGRGDLLISIMSSLAQEESSTLSKITHLGIVYRFQEGKVWVNHKWFLGYTKDEKGDVTQF